MSVSPSCSRLLGLVYTVSTVAMVRVCGVAIFDANRLARATLKNKQKNLSLKVI